MTYSNENERRFKVREAAQLLGRPVAYYPVFTRICGGNANAGIFLSQFYYWEGKQADPDGWIYKGQRQIQNETGLSRYPQESARKALRTLGILQEARKGVPAKLHYKFDWNVVDDLIVRSAGGENLKDYLAQKKKEAQESAAQSEPEIRKTNHIAPAIEVWNAIYLDYMRDRCEDPDGEYKFEWTGKEVRQLKNLVARFRTRLANRHNHQHPNKITAEEITPEQAAQDGIKPFLELYVEMASRPDYETWNMQSLCPSAIISHLPDILTKMQIFHETNGRNQRPGKKGHHFDSTHKDRIENAAKWGN